MLADRFSDLLQWIQGDPLIAHRVSDKIYSFFSDSFWLLSVVGIWPRYIEPRILLSSHLTLNVPLEHADLEGKKIIHFSDLHFRKDCSPSFLKRLARRIGEERPDIIVFTGDFLCHSSLEKKERLKKFLSSLHAPLGCYCTFGNHDYAHYVSRGLDGNYDVSKKSASFTTLFNTARKLLSPAPQKGVISTRARSVGFHEELCALLGETPFQILENDTVTLPIGKTKLNICGLGDYALGRCSPENAFSRYERDYMGIVLSHNPDTFPLLTSFPGDLVLSGHTHGEQIHFPFPKWMRWISKKLASVENPAYTRGFFKVGNKKLYITRGVGSHKSFRFCSPPEIVILTFACNGSKD